MRHYSSAAKEGCGLRLAVAVCCPLGVRAVPGKLRMLQASIGGCGSGYVNYMQNFSTGQTCHRLCCQAAGHCSSVVSTRNVVLDQHTHAVKLEESRWSLLQMDAMLQYKLRG